MLGNALGPYGDIAEDYGPASTPPWIQTIDSKDDSSRPLEEVR